MRGVGFCRANQYGKALDSYLASANEETFVCVQIEHIDAVRAIDEILAVPGVDAVMIGPYDLSASMGIPAQFSHPKMISAIDSVGEACARHGVTAGIHVVQPDVEEVLRRHQAGYRFIAYSLDITMLMTACRDGLSRIHAGINGRKD
jgi:2-dehydro-3-deoxyglucarate aldolase